MTYTRPQTVTLATSTAGTDNRRAPTQTYGDCTKMFEATEVNTQLNEIDPSLVWERGQQRRMATCTVLFEQEPTEDAPFIQIREWCTVDESAAELIAEYGYLNGDGDLENTMVFALPCNWKLVQALAWLRRHIRKQEA